MGALIKKRRPKEMVKPTYFYIRLNKEKQLWKSKLHGRLKEGGNLKLSDERARSTMQYIISKGINGSRLEARGYGESSPKVDCGANCTEEQHAINRRSEFTVVKRVWYYHKGRKKNNETE